MSHISIDLIQIYKTYFGSSYEIDEQWHATFQEQATSVLGIEYTKPGLYGRRIFFPVELFVSNDLRLAVDCATIKVSNKKTIIKTPVARRIGTVKEQYAVGDYVFTINGVLVNDMTGSPVYPDHLVHTLKEIYESRERVDLLNVIAEIFTMNGGENRSPVVIESLEFHEKKGDVRHVPFTLVCETDFAEKLIVANDIQPINMSSNVPSNE